MSKEPDYIEAPVTVDYDQNNVIGTLKVDRNRLPKTSNYVFAVGGLVKQSHMQWDEELGRQVNVITDFELIQVTVLPEEEYAWPGRREPTAKA